MEREVKTTIRRRIWFESVIDEAMQFAKERERENGCVTARSGVGMKNWKVSKMVEPAVLFARLSPLGEKKRQFLRGLAVQARGPVQVCLGLGGKRYSPRYFSVYICMYNCIIV
ncbi:hypothetical protein MOSE0_D02894 [Monosporozyma servazzii]